MPVSDEVSFVSPRGRIEYRDSLDHFQNGLLRLLGLEREHFVEWLARADELDAGDPLKALGRAYASLRALPDGVAVPGDAAVDVGPGGEPGAVWHARIAESPAFGVARAADGGCGWLIQPGARGWERVCEPPHYEEAYFEGDKSTAGGYGNYAAQQGWRLEKSARQVRELVELGVLHPGERVLDVGSGYGFFRRALSQAGFEHEGLEISGHARDAARSLYGFDSAGGTLADQRERWEGRFDLVTLWDMLEHVADPVALLRDVAHCLRPGGRVAIKTPNLDCPEAEVFGPHYHSLKREHLIYFGPAGLTAAARAAGLERVYMSSLSHLLLGFVGRAQISEWQSQLRGADLMAVFRKPSDKV